MEPTGRIAMIGAGRMGANMARRLVRSGFEVVLHDVDAAALATMADEGFATAGDLADLVSRLETPRLVWMMIPAPFVGGTVDALAPLLDAGDVVVDGGNSWYRDAITRSSRLAESGVHYVDVGTSGGVHGLDRGYCLMVGGPDEAVGLLEPALGALAPGIDAAPRTPGRTGDAAPAELGWLHCGPSGAGHFVKMVHNGIEYGLMAAYAEGFNVLHRAGAGIEGSAIESGHLRDPAAYAFDIDVGAVAELWRRGSVVGSWLLDLTAAAMHTDPALAAFDGTVADSGEGRWTVQAAVDLAAPVPVLATALFSRFSSRGEDLFAGKVLSAMRHGFGGHAEGRADHTSDEVAS